MLHKGSLFTYVSSHNQQGVSNTSAFSEKQFCHNSYCDQQYVCDTALLGLVHNISVYDQQFVSDTALFHLNSPIMSHSMDNSMWVMWKLFSQWLHCIWSPIGSEWYWVFLLVTLTRTNREWVTAFVLQCNITTSHDPQGVSVPAFVSSIHHIQLHGQQGVSVSVFFLLLITSNSMANRRWVYMPFFFCSPLLHPWPIGCGWHCPFQPDSLIISKSHGQ